MTAPVALRQEVSLRKRLPLRHFRQLHGPDLRHLFHRQPEPFGDRADRELLAIALGATLYAPATRADLADTIRRRAERGVCSMVIDLEDAVADHEVETAKRRAVAGGGGGAPGPGDPPPHYLLGGGTSAGGLPAAGRDGAALGRLHLVVGDGVLEIDHHRAHP
ncbi:HpcH/HpaI aldolase/citrate lyase family protein, partial [Nocardia farcinica]|uniref:HpcH/HpaI aldolase/citrate lyase family protein n=1 Tax=Nocardia farcinica TaxID=37329 RepID=UPI00245773B4